jgi:hypothetical protein
MFASKVWNDYPLVLFQSMSDVTFLILGSESHPKLAGAVLVCSVPPSGNRYFSSHLLPIAYLLSLFYLSFCNSFVSFIGSGLVWRYLLTKPVAAVKVNGSALLNFSFGVITIQLDLLESVELT